MSSNQSDGTGTLVSATTSYVATVRGGRPSHAERCAANSTDLERIGRGAGHQVRIRRSVDHVALYTVEQTSVAPGTIGMTASGRRRLHGTGEFAVMVDAQVVNLTATDAEAEATGEFVERLEVGRSRELAVLAPHGGEIEPHTDVQAQEVRLALGPVAPWVWMCKGWRPGGGAHAQWHITSTDISRKSFPLLDRMMRRRFSHAVSFHGFDRLSVPGPDIRIGGLADEELKASVRDAIEDEFRQKGKSWEVAVVKPEEPLSGMDPENIVNRLAPISGGLQIEQSLRARRDVGLEIARAVASCYRSLLSFRP